MRVIPQLLYRRAIEVGVDLRCGARVRRIHCEAGRVTGVDVEESGPIACDAVVSSYHGVGTYDELVDGTPAAVRQRLRALPLQSPGMCAYIATEGPCPGLLSPFPIQCERRADPCDRAARLAHRSPWIRGLYLAGASTHPGQWVSFCAISGVLAANALHADAPRA
jgi:phytoene dehydrogenase-like protein